MATVYTAHTHPSLAFVKYWGKALYGRNIPLTSSVAMTINTLTTTVSVRVRSALTEERVIFDGQPTPQEIYMKNYRPFLDYCRQYFHCPQCFWEVMIKSDYPLAAGLASSSAIYAGLTLAIEASCNDRSARSHSIPASAMRKLSGVARRGSASAARALFGGVVCLPARRGYAHCYIQNGDWPELRLIIAYCSTEQKYISSREAMRCSKKTSPLFRYWRKDSARWYREAKRSFANHDLERLGWSMQQSYLTMFATMHTSRPPIFYWNAQSLSIIKQAHYLRKRGIPIWETMDAGPQVKLLTTQKYVKDVLHELQNTLNSDKLIVSELGAPPHCAIG